MEKTQNQLHLLNDNIASKLCQVYNPESILLVSIYISKLLGLYCMASARCGALMISLSSWSAIVRASFKMR